MTQWMSSKTLIATTVNTGKLIFRMGPEESILKLSQFQNINWFSLNMLTIIMIIIHQKTIGLTVNVINCMV